MKEGIWASRLSKSDAKQHHTCPTYGFPQHIIEKRHPKILILNSNDHQLITKFYQLSPNEEQVYSIKDFS
jgi:hypothetical protein